MRNIKVAKATDGLVGNPTNKKPRYYAVIHVENGTVAVVKIYTTDPKNKKDAEKIEKKIRKRIGNFGVNSAIDKKLYTKKTNGNYIKLRELDFEATNHFQFDEKQSISIYRFVLEDKDNIDPFIDYIKSVIKKRT